MINLVHFLKQSFRKEVKVVKNNIYVDAGHIWYEEQITIRRYVFWFFYAEASYIITSKGAKWKPEEGQVVPQGWLHTLNN